MPANSRPAVFQESRGEQETPGTHKGLTKARTSCLSLAAVMSPNRSDARGLQESQCIALRSNTHLAQAAEEMEDPQEVWQELGKLLVLPRLSPGRQQMRNCVGAAILEFRTSIPVVPRAAASCPPSRAHARCSLGSP